MYTVYVLISQKNGDVYVGSTENIENRLSLHNKGRVRSTKAYRPWELLEIRTCTTRSEAVRLELFLKTGQQKEMLRKRYMAT
ncbi:MAG: endonuclease [Candidatus Taylorbacteria bacterium CG11_big_fil_rev_8_21_14_0_20_46_11]|uniref:Endonuclease n=1 Tax=Candidatus Taylorbacteria bacterium CG11_big_fil_rev_8_21_14_0_20_46_11 TaxID=1975025 RepID=A0A2H0KBZ9_9BACT|nr:MAG: endonuclease [Candidatus Taylorbacteria bacterium CG11_big_fil_rev_8_21_14_0_20_46_11]